MNARKMPVIGIACVLIMVLSQAWMPKTAMASWVCQWPPQFSVSYEDLGCPISEINNLPPSICITSCGEYAMPFGSIDLCDLRQLGAAVYRNLTLPPAEQTDSWCMDEWPDGRVNRNDVTMYLTKFLCRGNMCPFSKQDLFEYHSYVASAPPPYTPGEAPVYNLGAGKLVVAGYRRLPGFLNNAVYFLNPDGTAAEGPQEAAGGARDHTLGPIITDKEGELYQIHFFAGLVRLSDGEVVVRPAKLNYHGWNYYVGPFTDAVFNPNNSNELYVSPIFLQYQSSSTIYISAAKLELIGDGEYYITQYYGYEPCGSFSAMLIDEIEIDRTGSRIFITTSPGTIQYSLLVYDEETGEELERTDLRPFMDPPTAFMASRYNDYLYFTSTSNQRGLNKLFRFAILENGINQTPAVAELEGIDHVASIAEDPDAGKLWLIGAERAEDLENIPVRLSVIEPQTSWPQTVNSQLVDCYDLGVPYASVFLPGETMQEAPQLNTVLPISGLAGSRFQVSGNDFGPAGASSRVQFTLMGRFGDIPAGDAGIIGWSDTEITCRVPDINPGPYKVTVITAGGVSNYQYFTVSQPYTPPPTTGPPPTTVW